MRLAELLPHQFFKSLRWQFAANLAQGVFGGVYLIALGKILGVEQFGVYSLATSLVAVLFLLIELRIHEVVIRFVCPEDKDFNSERAGFWISDLFILDVVLRVVVFVVMALIVKIMGRLEWFQSVPVSVLALAALSHFVTKAGNSVAVGTLRAVNRFDTVAVVVASEWFLKLLTLFVLVWLGKANLPAAILVAALIGFVSNTTLQLWSISVWRKQYYVFPGVQFRGLVSRLKEAKRYIFSNLGISLSDLLVKDLDVVITGAFVPVEAVGIYRMAKNVVQVMWRVVDPFYMVVMPELRKMESGDNPTAERAKFIRGLVWVLGGIGLGLYLAGWAALAVVGPDVFSGDFSQVVTLFPYMGLWVFVCSPLIWAPPLAISSGHPELPLIGGAIGNAAGLLLFIPLAKYFGITGAGIGWSLSLIFVFAATAFLCRSRGLLGKS